MRTQFYYGLNKKYMFLPLIISHLFGSSELVIGEDPPTCIMCYLYMYQLCSFDKCIVLINVLCSFRQVFNRFINQSTYL